MPVGGGGAWPGFEIDHSEPQARVWRSRGRAAAHGRIKQPGLTKHTRRPEHPRAPNNGYDSSDSLRGSRRDRPR